MKSKDFIGKKLLQTKSRRLSDDVAEIRSRVKIVEDQNECEKITKHLIGLGKPIGVDLEGNRQSPGLIQVRSNEKNCKNIYLFRTGIRPALLYEGGLAKLLEHPNVLKILCGADQDICSLMNANITLNSFFDISVAQKIIEYQNHGTELFSMKRTRDEESKMLTTSFLGNLKSLQQICSDYGFKENNFDKGFGGKTNYYFSAPNLPEELIAYCAADVDQLIELYQMMKPKIANDFKPIFRDISEAQIFRYIDKNLDEKRRLKLRKMSRRSVFFSNLRSDIGKMELFQNLKSFDGDKKIMLANITQQPTAHVIMDSVELALEVFKKFSRKPKKFSSDFGDQFKIELLLKSNQEKELRKRGSKKQIQKDFCDQAPSWNQFKNNESKRTTSPLPDSEWTEILNEKKADQKTQKLVDNIKNDANKEPIDTEIQKSRSSKKSENWITNVSQAHLISQKLIEMEYPILLKFFQDSTKTIKGTAEEDSMVELYLGQSISLIFSVDNQEILTALTPLFESNQVVKIIFGGIHGTNQHRKSFHHQLNSQGIKMTNLFDLMQAIYVLHYYKNGYWIDIEKTTIKSTKSVITRFGLETKRPEIKDSQIIAYHYLNNQIPTELFPLIKNRSDLSDEVYFGNKNEVKDQIKHLNDFYQTSTMFLRKNIKSVIEILKKLEIDFNIIYGNEDISIVNFGGLSESCYTDEEKSSFSNAMIENLNGTLIGTTKEMPEEPEPLRHSEIQKFIDLHEEKVTKLKNLELFEKFFQNTLKTEKEGKSSEKERAKTKSQFETKAPVW